MDAMRQMDADMQTETPAQLGAGEAIATAVDSCVCASVDGEGAAALDAFWKEWRLLHRKEVLHAFLGAEVLEDLNDVPVRELKTIRAGAWAEATLTIAEANRLRRAVQAYHAGRRTPETPENAKRANGR